MIRLFSLLFFVVAFFLPRIFFSSFNAFFFLNSFLSLFSRVLFLIFLSFSQFFFTLFNFSLSPLSFCSLHHFFVFSLYRFFVPLSLPNIFFPLSFFPYPTVVIAPLPEILNFAYSDCIDLMQRERERGSSTLIRSIYVLA